MTQSAERKSFALITLKNWNACHYLLSVVENQWPRIQFVVLASRDGEGVQTYTLSARGEIGHLTGTQLAWFARGVAAAIGAPMA